MCRPECVSCRSRIQACSHTYLPSCLVIPDVPQEEDEEINEIPRAVEIETPEESINIMRTNIAHRASALMDDFGIDFIPVSSRQFRQGPWTVLMLPVCGMSFTDLPNAYRTATKGTRNRTKHDEVWVVHFPKALPATENLPGLNQPCQGRRPHPCLHTRLRCMATDAQRSSPRDT